MIVETVKISEVTDDAITFKLVSLDGREKSVRKSLSDKSWVGDYLDVLRFVLENKIMLIGEESGEWMNYGIYDENENLIMDFENLGGFQMPKEVAFFDGSVGADSERRSGTEEDVIFFFIDILIEPVCEMYERRSAGTYVDVQIASTEWEDSQY